MKKYLLPVSASIIAACILACNPMASMILGADTAVTVFQSDFGRGEDANGDGWPDNWKRQLDRDHPAYLKMRLVNRSAMAPDELQKLRRNLTQWSLAIDQRKLPGDTIPESVPREIDAFLEKTVADGCLEILTNGGRAQVESPSFPINFRNSYRLSIEWTTEFVDPYFGEVSLLWLDEADQVLDEIVLDSTTRSMDWTRAAIDETSWIPSGAKYARFRVALHPQSPRSIQASLRIDRVRMERIPKVELAVEPRNRVVKAGEDLRLECQLKEIDPKATIIQFMAIDHNGVEVWKDSPNAPEFDEKTSERASHSRSLVLPLPGYYRLVAEITSGNTQRITKELSVAVLPNNGKYRIARNSRIGLSLPRLGKQITLDQVSALAELSNAGAVKLSVWLADEPARSQKSMGWVVERLSLNGVRCIGVIDAPSAEQASKFPTSLSHDIGSFLDYPEIWKRVYEPVWRKTALFLTHYQVGWDDDNSLEQHRNWRERLMDVKRSLRAAGGECKLAIPWNSLNTPPLHENENGNPSTATIERILYNNDVPYTKKELEAFSESSTSMPSTNWLQLRQLKRSIYSIQDRVRELTSQLLIAHKYGWETVWIDNLISDESGYIDDAGGPRELIIPLRNLAAALNNSTDFESVRVSDQLNATLFRTDTSNSLIIASEQIGEYGLYLGDDWTASDVWGRPMKIDSKLVSGVPTRTLKLDGWPVIISNVDQTIIKWQQEVVIENPIIENRVGLSEPVRVRLTNPSEASVRGMVEIVAPALLEDSASQSKFEMTSNRPSVVEVPMKLRFDAGQNQELVDVIVRTDEKPARSFLVQRQLLVGLKDFRIESQTEFDGQGTMSVNLEMFNLGASEANFDCTLVVPGRRRIKFHLVRVVDRVEKKLQIENAEELRGESLYLRCEEIGSGRVINHRVLIDK
jgi:hypothetical protein